MADATIEAGNVSAWHVPRLKSASCLTRLVRPQIFAWIVATPGEKLGVSRTCCFVCTSDRRDMHAVHDRWLETGENTCPVLDIIDIVSKLPNFKEG